MFYLPGGSNLPGGFVVQKNPTDSYIWTRKAPNERHELLADQLIPLMDNWPEERKAEFARTLQGILRDKPSDPSQLDAWADEGKKKFLAGLLGEDITEKLR